MALNAGTQNFKINESNGESTITILGTIGESWFTEGYTMQNAKQDLANISTPKINLIIASEGGLVDDALVIHDLIKMHKAEVTSQILGATASSGTIVAQAADKGKLQMSKNSMHLVHPVSDMVIGNAEDHRKAAEQLDKFDKLFVDIYSDRIGNKKTKDEIKAQMDKAEWNSASDAKAFGFVDEVFTPGSESTKIDSFDTDKINACERLPNINGTSEPVTEPVANPGDMINELRKKFNAFKDNVTSKLGSLKINLDAPRIDPAIQANDDDQTSKLVNEIQGVVDEMALENKVLVDKLAENETKHKKIFDAYSELAVKHGDKTQIESIDAIIDKNNAAPTSNQKSADENAEVLRAD